jgi:hypothetical protein
MANQASWSGKVQIDGGQTLVLGDQLPLGVGPTFLGSDSLPVTLPESDGKKETTQTVRVLAAADLAHILAIKADAYHDPVPSDAPTHTAPTGELKIVFKNASKEGKPITLSGDVMITGKDILAAIQADWVSIKLSSTLKQNVSVQILVVREL